MNKGSDRPPEKRAYSVFKDGSAWCATGFGFLNLQESLAGFGDSPVTALGELIIAENEAEMERWKTIRRWKCNNCKTHFSRRHASDGISHGTGPDCLHCKCGGQYTYEVRA